MNSAIITGAGGGIGSAIAKTLAQEKYELFLLDKNEQSLKVVQKEIHKEFPKVKVTTSKTDLSNPKEIHAFFSTHRAHLQNLSVLVNNAGISIGSDIFTLSLEDWDLDQSINLRAPFLLTQQAVLLMKQHGGSIVNISSLAGIQGAKKPNYASSKAGILGLTKSCASVVGQYGIRVNAIFPGAVDTPLIADWDEEKRNMISQQTALRRIAKSQDIANVVSFLISEKSSFITGSVINVTGGQYLGQ